VKEVVGSGELRGEESERSTRRWGLRLVEVGFLNHRRFLFFAQAVLRMLSAFLALFLTFLGSKGSGDAS